ncbi:MAG: NDP-hexose 4-ketoreductase, partial [Planctomycetota bacterium]
FRPLNKEDLHTVVDFELSKVFKRLTERGMELELDRAAKDFLIDKGYNPDFGARPLRRAISKYVEDPLAEGILKDDFQDGQLIKVTREDEKDFLKFVGEPKPAAPEDEASDDSESSPDESHEEPAEAEV